MNNPNLPDNVTDQMIDDYWGDDSFIQRVNELMVDVDNEYIDNDAIAECVLGNFATRHKNKDWWDTTLIELTAILRKSCEQQAQAELEFGVDY